MTVRQEWTARAADVAILRALGRRVTEIAGSAENLERRDAWFAHDAGDPRRPMVLIELFGVDEREFPEEYRRTECVEEWAQERARSERNMTMQE